MNMSYCRWENTNNDLRDCAADLEERAEGMAAVQLSDDELGAAIALLCKAQKMLGTIRNAIDVYSEADLTVEEIGRALGKIEQEAQRYNQDDEEEQP